MNQKNLTKSRVVAAGAFVLLIIASDGAKAGTGDGIVFLNLSLVGDTVQLVDWSLYAGKLKQARIVGERDGIVYEALAKSGDVLWRGTVSNPSERQFEYEDPGNPGHLLAKMVKSDSSRFVVRIPANGAIDQVQFFEVKGSRPHGDQKNITRKSLGIVTWPLVGGRK